MNRAWITCSLVQLHFLFLENQNTWVQLRIGLIVKVANAGWTKNSSTELVYSWKKQTPWAWLKIGLLKCLFKVFGRSNELRLKNLLLSSNRLAYSPISLLLSLLSLSVYLFSLVLCFVFLHYNIKKQRRCWLADFWFWEWFVKFVG